MQHIYNASEILGGKGEVMMWRSSLIGVFVLCGSVSTTILFSDHVIDIQKDNIVVQEDKKRDSDAEKNAISFKKSEKQKKYCNGAVMHPVIFTSPQEIGAAQVIERKGVITKRPGAKATILICHGYMCNKDDTALFRLIFQNYNVMTFDFRAHGEKVDESHCCTFGKDEMCDVLSAVNLIKSDPDLKNLPLIVYGFSMGAVASIRAQAEDSSLFDGMILDCPYDKSENVIKNAINSATITLFGYKFHIPGRSFLERFAFNPYVQSFLKVVLKTVVNMNPDGTNTRIYPLNPVDSMQKISVPCFFIHCRHDEKVPLEAGKAVYAQAQGPKRFWVTNGRRHFDSFFYNPEKYVYRVNKFIESILTKKIDDEPHERIFEDEEVVDA